MRIVILIILSFVSEVANSKNYHVQPLGSDNNDGLSFNKAFLTIQRATNIALAGDSILVYDGMYKGFDHFYKNSGTATQPIVYFAKGKNVIINQSCGRGGDGLNIEGNEYIEVNGFKVQFIPDISGSGEDGIRAVLANHITIRNCEVDSCYRGIFTGYTDDFLAEYNICKRSFGEHGIYVSNNSDRVVIRYNLCFNNRRAAGIQLNPDLSSGPPGLSYNVKIYNNICFGNRIGLNLQGIYYSEVYNNLIYNNGQSGGGNGVTFFLGDAATGCNNVKFYNNTVVVPSTSQWAILGLESDSIQVYNNILVSFSAKGSMYIDRTCTNFISDYNCLNDKLTRDDGLSYINLQQWQQLGYDQHSQLIKDIPGLFKSYSNLDFQLSEKSLARNNGSSIVNTLVTNDLNLISRPQGTSFDIGCYEYAEISHVENYKVAKKISYTILNSELRILEEGLEREFSLLGLDGRLIKIGKIIDIGSLSGIFFIKSSNAIEKICLIK